MKKEVIKHLKEDIEEHKEAIRDDKKLIKKLQKKKMCSPMKRRKRK